MTRRDENTTHEHAVRAVGDGGMESSMTPGDPGIDVKRSPFLSVVRLLRGDTRDIELRTRIGSLEAELNVLDSRLDENDATSQARVRSARNLLSDATRHLNWGRIDEAWGHYNTALRMVVHVSEAVGDEGTLSAQSRAVYEEALDALAGGPRRTVVALLTNETGVQTPPAATDLAEAMRVLHAQYERVALTRQYLQSQFNQMLLQGTVSLVLLFLLAVGASYNVSRLLVEPLSTTELRSIGFALYVVLVGIIGASVFGMRTLRDQPLSTRATRKAPGLFVTGARAFIGATSALFLVFVLFTELVSFDQAVTAPMALAVAFAGGYSERLAPQAVDTVSQVVPSRSNGGDRRSAEVVDGRADSKTSGRTGGAGSPRATRGTDES